VAHVCLLVSARGMGSAGNFISLWLLEVGIRDENYVRESE
jgi:hypothetical protein